MVPTMSLDESGNMRKLNNAHRHNAADESLTLTAHSIVQWSLAYTHTHSIVDHFDRWVSNVPMSNFSYQTSIGINRHLCQFYHHDFVQYEDNLWSYSQPFLSIFGNCSTMAIDNIRAVVASSFFAQHLHVHIAHHAYPSIRRLAAVNWAHWHELFRTSSHSIQYSLDTFVWRIKYKYM